MKLPAPQRKEPEENVIPLINIVFLLLIFFMVAGTLTPSQPFDIDLPATEKGGEMPRDPLRIYLSGDGRVALADEEVSVEDLESRIAAQLDESPDLPVQIEADGSAQSKVLLDVMDALRDAGVERADLVTRRE
ncbi:biopolymer transporter ExbD [Halorhodospira halochloris]|uniref:Biopolymer transport protein ExbD/TolR n=1 Tax=Halorhodospira halochloris TaxID=1052 RepID=A0A125T2T0_HALHR|nr:biopolymer transporter ExbD [Halorhodospira halochloris]MBK1651857.1 hypothetical protein [Halorhodospira halochloris]MCG5529954.1 biopolymer transporter ExbD [Halorhodospira halochloris]BAU58808.1 biopolymer transport protein ExbD/TolR [Halorhodospira halochloris]